MRLRGKIRCCRGRIGLLKECLSEGVAPKDIVVRIINSRARHTLAMKKAFLLDEINKEESRLLVLIRRFNRDLCEAKEMLLKFDFVRLCHYIGEINCKKTVDEVKEGNELVGKLRVSRYGNIDTSSHVVNLSSYQLSNIETEVLSRGLKFAMPPQKVKREAVLSEFESLWAQLENLSPESNEAVAACKAKLSDIAHAYSGTPIDCKDFSLTREHLIALANLRKNKNLVICKPGKGPGVVILDSCDYNAKMMQILGDKEKFCTI